MPVGTEATTGMASKHRRASLPSPQRSSSTSAPKLSAWLEANLPQGFTVFALPLAHQLRLCTSNALERVNQELKRHTRVAGLFPNEASLLRLITALLNEISDEWQTTKVYLNMEKHPQPSV
jgi:transposase-like protein